MTPSNFTALCWLHSILQPRRWAPLFLHVRDLVSGSITWGPGHPHQGHGCDLEHHPMVRGEEASKTGRSAVVKTPFPNGRMGIMIVVCSVWKDFIPNPSNGNRVFRYQSLNTYFFPYKRDGHTAILKVDWLYLFGVYIYCWLFGVGFCIQICSGILDQRP